VGPLLVSSDYVGDDAAGDELAAKLHEELTSASGPVERKAEVRIRRTYAHMRTGCWMVECHAVVEYRAART
jgi:hypothetical protein